VGGAGGDGSPGGRIGSPTRVLASLPGRRRRDPRPLVASAGPAAPEHGEVVGADGEPVAAVEVVAQLGEGGVGNLDHRTADLAHQVLVGLVGQVVHGPPVSEVHVVDYPDALEGVEAPVDGGQVDVRLGLLHQRGQVV